MKEDHVSLYGLGRRHSESANDNQLNLLPLSEGNSTLSWRIHQHLKLFSPLAVSGFLFQFLRQCLFTSVTLFAKHTHCSIDTSPTAHRLQVTGFELTAQFTKWLKSPMGTFHRMAQNDPLSPQQTLINVPHSGIERLILAQRSSTP